MRGAMLVGRGGLRMIRRMPVRAFIERVGRSTQNLVAAWGDFWLFVGQTFANITPAWLKWKNFKQILIKTTIKMLQKY